MKLSKNQQIYKEYSEQMQLYLNNLTDEQIKQILRTIKNNRDMLLNEIAQTILSYDVNNNVLNLSIIEKRILINKFNELINNTLSNELKEERKLLNNMLINSAKEKELTLNFLNDLGQVNTDIKKADKQTINKIVNANVKGKNWSKRYGDNKNAIAKRLRKDIKDLLNGDTDINSIKNNIVKTYNTNANMTKRLVSNEVTRVQEEICEEWQKNNGVEYVMYSATLEHNTCSECGQYDGKVYEINKKPVKIPEHPNCKCCYIGLPNKNWKPKTRLDNTSKENILWTTFEEWKGR